jgi:hypothetical protein
MGWGSEIRDSYKTYPEFGSRGQKAPHPGSATLANTVHWRHRPIKVSELFHFFAEPPIFQAGHPAECPRSFWNVR